MKNIVFVFFLLLTIVLKSQTAVNFTATDCASANHNLFSELNAGKVVVITWVMPCATCIGPTLSAENEIQNFLLTKPGRIYHYIVDDFANTTCTTLNSWCISNGIVNSTARFSNSAINMNDYGSSGMPKTVIIAGTNHNVFFNEDNTLTVSSFNAAMNNALAAAESVGLEEKSITADETFLSPVPANEFITVSCLLKDSKGIVVDVFNSAGFKIKSQCFDNLVSGKNTIKIQTSEFSDGMYFLKLDDTCYYKFFVSHF